MIITFSSGRSCGVTTTALSLALVWPRPVIVVEADPSGGSIAVGWMAGQQYVDTSLVEIAEEHRASNRPITADWITSVAVDLPGSKAWFIHGSQGPSQADYVATAYESLIRGCEALSSDKWDVFVDLGRYTANVRQWYLHADLNLIVTGSTLPDLVATQPVATTVKGLAARMPVKAVIVGPNNPYPSHEAEKVLDIPVMTTMANDPVTAEFFTLGANATKTLSGDALNNSKLVTSANRAVGEITELLVMDELKVRNV